MNKEIINSWGRSFLAGVLTAYIAGIMEPKVLLAAGLAAVAPVILRWLNPNDPTFGRLPAPDHLKEH